MKWLLIGAVALALFFGLPFRQYNTEALLPIETVQVLLSREGVTLVSEAGSGKGADWQEAVEDLRQNASGEVFFHTAEQVVLCDAGEDLLPQLLDSGMLRPAARVCRAKELYEPEGLGEYLATHGSKVTVRELQGAIARKEGISLPTVTPPLPPWEEVGS